MKITAISFFFFLLPLASALTFEFSQPSSVELYENFSVSISATTSDSYDVKIIVQDNKTRTTLSEIYNDGWKNPFYYLKSAFPGRTSFLVRVKNASDDAFTCVRLRKTGASSYSEECKALSISSSVAQGSSDEEEPDSAPEEVQSTNTTASSSSQKLSSDFTPSEEKNQQTSAGPLTNSERIILNSPAASNFLTKDEKLRLYALYAFTAFILILVIFLIFKKL